MTMIAKQIEPPGYVTLRVLLLIQQERKRQHTPLGVQDLKPTEWLATLTEEVGEAAKSAFTLQQSQHDPVFLEDLREDLVQVAAVAVQWLESIERETLESSLTTIRHLRPGAEEANTESQVSPDDSKDLDEAVELLKDAWDHMPTRLQGAIVKVMRESIENGEAFIKSAREVRGDNE